MLRGKLLFSSFVCPCVHLVLFSPPFPVYVDPEVCYGSLVPTLTSVAGKDLLCALTSVGEFSLFSEDVGNNLV